MASVMSFPTRIVYGRGAIKELPGELKRVGASRPLLVTDKGILQAGLLRFVTPLLDQAGVKAQVFSDFEANPTDRDALRGIEAFRAANADSVLGVGGGASLDMAKAIALLVNHPPPLEQYDDAKGGDARITAAVPPIIQVPTTAGTGSEVGRSTVLVIDGTKTVIFSPFLMARAAILDPELTVGLPPAITAATGMDAFVHCFEAFCAPGFHPLADGVALEGLRLIQTYLPRAYDNGKDIEARSRMLAAASMGATAFQKGLGGVHAIAHPVGAHFNTHHGLTNAVVLPYIIVHNRRAIESHLPIIARTLNLPGEPFAAMFDWVLGFRKRLNIPHSLAEIGVPLSNPDTIGHEASLDPSAAGNPLPTDAAAYARIFRSAVKGDLKLAG